MEIISLSLDDETLEQTEEIQENSSYNGRSELFRQAIENLHQETSDSESSEGTLNAVVVARHPH